MEVTKKVCNICRVSKKLEYFNKERFGICGTRATCAECNKQKLKNKIIHATCKTCKTCGISKGLSMFYKDRSGHAGVKARCIKCHKKYVKSHTLRLSIKKVSYPGGLEEYLKSYLKDYTELKIVMNRINFVVNLGQPISDEEKEEIKSLVYKL